TNRPPRMPGACRSEDRELHRLPAPSSDGHRATADTPVASAHRPVGPSFAPTLGGGLRCYSGVTPGVTTPWTWRRSLQPVTDAELGEAAADVSLRRRLVDMHRYSDISAGRPTRHQPQDTVLAIGERRELRLLPAGRRHQPAVTLEQSRRDARVEPRCSY